MNVQNFQAWPKRFGSQVINHLFLPTFGVAQPIPWFTSDGAVSYPGEISWESTAVIYAGNPWTWKISSSNPWEPQASEERHFQLLKNSVIKYDTKTTVTAQPSYNRLGNSSGWTVITNLLGAEGLDPIVIFDITAKAY